MRAYQYGLRPRQVERKLVGARVLLDVVGVVDAEDLVEGEVEEVLERIADCFQHGILHPMSGLCPNRYIRPSINHAGEPRQ
jgi:hypothetical protein